MGALYKNEKQENKIKTAALRAFIIDTGYMLNYATCLCYSLSTFLRFKIQQFLWKKRTWKEQASSI